MIFNSYFKSSLQNRKIYIITDDRFIYLICNVLPPVFHHARRRTVSHLSDLGDVWNPIFTFVHRWKYIFKSTVRFLSNSCDLSRDWEVFLISRAWSKYLLHSTYIGGFVGRLRRLHPLSRILKIEKNWAKQNQKKGKKERVIQLVYLSVCVYT